MFQASSDGNTTVSILAFRPKMENIGKVLVCKASNPLIKQSEIMDDMKLRIDCKYIMYVNLSLSHTHTHATTSYVCNISHAPN